MTLDLLGLRWARGTTLVVAQRAMSYDRYSHADRLPARVAVPDIVPLLGLALTLPSLG